MQKGHLHASLRQGNEHFNSNAQWLLAVSDQCSRLMNQLLQPCQSPWPGEMLICPSVCSVPPLRDDLNECSDHARLSFIVRWSVEGCYTQKPDRRLFLVTTQFASLWWLQLQPKCFWTTAEPVSHSARIQRTAHFQANLSPRQAPF